ncbi:alanine racemase [Streptococcus sp. E17BB]|uniref:alanine racemase n=1 Tax=Streptococcus sp. E17BB TaxID=3278714 RepID=UPI00359F043F
MVTSLHRPTWATVNLNHIRSNIQQIIAHLPKPVKTLAVVKADAYGHGAVPVAQSIRDLVSGFCVSNLDEAIELRQAGLQEMILVLGVVPPQHVPLAIANNITLTVASLDWVIAAQEEGVDLSQITVHLKIDSGMGRLGFRQAAETKQAMACLSVAGVAISGIFTHFATADEEDDCYLRTQLSEFKEHLKQLDWVPELVHASNSAAAIWQEETVFDAVRLGVSIYGLNPSGTALPLPYSLKPALGLSSRLVQVKRVDKCSAIGYGATYHSAGEEVIGTVPIGYADGYIRDLAGFHVLVDGQECPIVGRVSMDQLTVRLPKAYPLGTEVVLLGTSGEREITLTEAAAHCQTINYELACLISDRVPRVYD